MKLVTSSQMRELDRRTIAEFGIPGAILMERAGQGVAAAVRRLLRVTGHAGARVLLVAGKGNNGGDAFVAARCLRDRGVAVELWLAGVLGEVKGDALRALHGALSAGLPFRELPAPADWDGADPLLSAGDVVVDGVLGTGLQGPAQGVAAHAIRFINRLSAQCPVVAIDIPSGLNADTGVAAGDAVVADVTVTMGLPKLGFVAPCAADYVGTVEVVAIGIPETLSAAVVAPLELITQPEVRACIPRRPRQAHKGHYGHVQIVSGAAGYAGAVTLAARAATRSGAGLVTAVVPRGIAPVVAGAVPETMVHGADETDTGSLAARCWEAWSARSGAFNALLMGPGMTTHAQTAELVARVLATAAAPLVLDADALNVFQGRAAELARAQGPVVITPHPGEMARLLGCTTAEVQADRVGAAQRAAEQTRATVVLKGAGTVVVQAGRPVSINLTGNPGMATGGMGDVLSGLLAGLLAQGLEAFQAACAAVFIHGRAGDLAAWRTSQAGLTAGDMIAALPEALQEVTVR